MTLTYYKDNSELFQNMVLWFTGRSETNLGFPVLPAGVTVTPNGSWTDNTTDVTRSVKNFDGSTNYVTVGTVSTFNFLHQVGTAGKWSITTWVKCNGFTKTYRIFTTDQSLSTNTGITCSILSTSGKIYIAITNGVSGQYIINNAMYDIPNDSDWHYLSLTYDQLLASENYKIYIDGTLNGSTTKTANTPSTSDASYAATIGGHSSTNILNGNMKDLMIWNDRVLTLPEIIEIMRLTNPASGRDFAAIYPGIRSCE